MCVWCVLPLAHLNYCMSSQLKPEELDQKNESVSNNFLLQGFPRQLPPLEEFKRNETYSGIIETLFILQAIKTRNDDEAEMRLVTS